MYIMTEAGQKAVPKHGPPGMVAAVSQLLKMAPTVTLGLLAEMVTVQ